ncbi:SPRY domain-containing protein 3-like [Glandiceps talaboti]
MDLGNGLVLQVRNGGNIGVRRIHVGRRRIDPMEHEHQPDKVRSERILVEGDILSYVPDHLRRVGLYIAAEPLTPDHSYYEVELIDTGELGTIGVGLVHKDYKLERQPGWVADSIGYHADDGKLFKPNGHGRDGHGRPFGPKCHSGDKIGCGIKFDQIEYEEGIRQQVPVFFTRNGKELGTMMTPMPATGLFPAIGMHSVGEEVRLHLDADWVNIEEDMMIDSSEDEWARLHDVRANGQLLEYVGRGRSIADVGLAQARKPLSPTNHYFEIEIVDPGKNCYIAIGLAHRDYPKYRHPGWNKGSIAYHADDGKIFKGSGIGDPFGPRCYKGDVMGCGIMFPRDYQVESDVESDDEKAEIAELRHHHDDDHVNEMYELEEYLDSSSSEDEEWYQDGKEEGVKVQIFFTRNGKTVGRREVRIPQGGFFPTVGMLSSDERVRVDLKPLTG